MNNLAEYLKLYKDLQTTPFQAKKRLRIALLSSFTLKGLKETLWVRCREIGIQADFYEGGYNQCQQEILSDGGELYAFSPEVVVLFMDLHSLAGERYLIPYAGDEADRRNWVEEKLAECRLLVDHVKERCDATVLLHNFEEPTHSPLGILENKQNFGFLESVRALNDSLRDAYKTDSRVFIFNYNNFSGFHGKKNVIDDKMYYLADMRIDPRLIPALADAYLGYFKAIASLTKKCLVVDLDNTLWGGVLGEDGFDGIQLGPTSEGRPFMEFQQRLLALHQRGVILAVNSRNNLPEVTKVFREHPGMVLKEDHFSAIRVNWDDKADNLKSIAAELNIGCESMVFLDDDKVTCEMVRAALPEVRVIDLPEDPSTYPQLALELDDFNATSLTEEDHRKGRLYAQERQRNAVKMTAGNINDYLAGLRIEVTLERANSFSIPRISQLTMKTNQFNMTTHRYAEHDIRRLSEDPRYLVLSVHVADKFGDAGIVGAVILEKGSEAWRIDTLLLSCRVIGRKIEEAILSFILNAARKAGAAKLTGEFLDSGRNQAAGNFFGQNGFAPVAANGPALVWEYSLAREYRPAVALTVKGAE